MIFRPWLRTTFSRTRPVGGPKRKGSPRSSRPESQTEVRHHPRTARINSEVRGVGRRYGRWGERCAKHSPIGRERCRLLNVANTGASAEAERLKALKASCLMQASASAASLWGPLLVHLLREYLRNETGSLEWCHMPQPICSFPCSQGGPPWKACQRAQELLSLGRWPHGP